MNITTGSSYEQRCIRWLERIDRADGITAVLQTCQDIFNPTDRCRTIEDDSIEIVPGSSEWGTRLFLNNELLGRLRTIAESPKSTFIQRRMIAKTMFKIYAQNYRYCRSVFPVGGVLSSGIVPADEAVAIYGMVYSGFFTLHGSEDLTGVVRRNFDLFQAMGCYSRYFITVGENLLTLQRMDQHDRVFAERQEKIWHVVLLNLESPYRGVRDCMLTILKQLISDHKFVRSVVLPAALHWSWLNRNKFHVLLALLSRYQLNKLDELAGERIDVYAALELSLHYKHLFSGSQGIARMLHKQQEEEIFELEVRILQRGSIDLVRSMIKQWFSNLTPGDFRKLFLMMDLDQLRVGENRKLMPEYLKKDRFVKFFQYMNLFRREFQSCKDLNILLVLMLQITTEIDLDYASMSLLVETLVHHITTPNEHIHPSTSVFYIFKLKEYILQQIGVPSMNVCNTFVVQCTKLLSYIASLPLERYEPNEDAYGIVSEMMGSTVFHQHLQKPPSQNYHAVLTSLRMFQAFASLFLEFTPMSPYRLQEKISTTTEISSYLLPMEADTFYDMIYTVEHLLTSDFDDVRSIALKLLYNRNTAFHYGPALQAKLSLIYSYRTTSAILEAMNSFFDESHTALLTSLRDHDRDLFAMMKNDYQLYQQIDGITEAFFGYEESRTLGVLGRIRSFPGMLLLVNRVVEFILRSMNCAKTDRQRRDMIGSSFEIMDNSLQLLLDRSSQRSTNLAADKKTMLKMLWKALRSAACFVENFATWVLDNYRGRLDVIQQLSICLRVFVLISLNCCHRGAIEATGVYFGRIIRKIAALKGRLVVRNDHRNRQARLIVDLCERMFRALIRLNLQDEDFRRCRGYLWLIHNFIKNDSYCNDERSYLRIYLSEQRLLLNNGQTSESLAKISIIQLHQLNLLVREASMNETVLEYIDDLMIIALERFKSTDWPTRNAALQLYSSIVTKLVGQRQQCSDPKCDWLPVYVSLNELIYKLVKSNKYILKELRNGDQSSTPFLILVLEFLSKVEYRAYNVPGQKSIVIDYRTLMWRYLNHENDQVRRLAATCFTQLHDPHEETGKLMENLIICFYTARGNENFRHGLLQVIHFMIRKHVTNARYMGEGFQKEEYLARVRQLLVRYWPLDDGKVGSYRLRCHLLDLLLYLGFDKMEPIVVEQVFSKLAPNSFGLNVFLMRTNALYNKSAQKEANDCAMEYEVVIAGEEKDDEIEED
ncbi:uncharacterized protein LOC131426443 [Malaya genurostris]|uniref:uncharacterized protein LOC131426443 n=1 Tax=Malaya genurostris TaxID=325434 RepID=UPI0026F3E073|nr:uncharacterized protein LOC131426443 [Malaya genurostris]